MRLTLNTISIPPTDCTHYGPVRTPGSQGTVTGINSSLVHDPGMAIVNSFHTASKQAARTHQKWRDDIANNRRAKETHEQEFGWRIVSHCSYQHQFFNSRCVVKCDSGSNCAPVRTSHYNCSIDSEAIQQTNNHPCLGSDCIFKLSGFTRIAIAREIRGNNSEATAGKFQ